MANINHKRDTTKENVKISAMLNQIKDIQDCVLVSKGLEINGNSNDAVSLLRAAERKFPDDIGILHRNLFAIIRRQTMK